MILYNAKIITMNNKLDIIENGWINIENGIIKEIGSGEVPYNENTKNMEGDLLLPGFINGHTHIAMTLLRGYADDKQLMDWLNNYIWPAENKFIDRDAVLLGSELGIMEMLANGITTFNDMYFFSNDSVKLAEKIGIRGLFAEGIIDFPTPNSKTPKEAIKYVLNSIEENKDNKLSKIIFSVHAPYTTSDTLIREVAELANDMNILFHIHTAETQSEIDIIKEKYNKTPIELLNNLIPENTKTVMAHMVHLTDNDMDIAFTRRFNAIHNPQSNLKLSSGIAQIEKMRQRGIIVGLGTDGTASNNNLDMIDEMRTASLIAKLENPEHLKSQDVVKMATIDCAKALHIDNILGSLEVNKQADIIRVSLKGNEAYPYYNNPYSFLVYSANSRDIKMTMINGNILYENGEFLTIDKERILNNVRKWSERLR